MILMSMENITRQSWDRIPMPDTVIDWVNLLRKDQPEIWVFTDWKIQLIVDADVDITEVDGDGDENEDPQQIENDNDLEYQEDKTQSTIQQGP